MEVLREVLHLNLDRELGKLSALQSQAVILRYMQGHSERDAAKIANCTMSAIKSRAFEGLAVLKRRLSHINPALGAALVPLMDAESKTEISATLLSSVKAAVLSAKVGTLAAGSSNAQILAKGVLKMMFWKQVKIVAVAIVAIAVVPSAVIIAQNTGTGSQDKGTPGKNSVAVSGSEQQNSNPSTEKAATQKTSPNKEKPNQTLPTPPSVLEGVIYQYNVPNEVIATFRDDKGLITKWDKLLEKCKEDLTPIHEENVIFKRNSATNVKWQVGEYTFDFNFEILPPDENILRFFQQYPNSRENIK